MAQPTSVRPIPPAPVAPTPGPSFPGGIGAALALIAVTWGVLPIVMGVLGGELVLSFSPLGFAQGSVNPGRHFAGTFAAGVASVAMLHIYLRRANSGWRALGFERCAPSRVIGWSVYGYVLAFVASTVSLKFLSLLFPSILVSLERVASSDTRFQEATAFAPALAILDFVVLTPVLEESLFRGVLFQALATRYGVSVPLLLSSALFAAMHGDGAAMVYHFFTGLMCCVLFVHLRSLWPAVGLHALTSLVATLSSPY